MNKSQLNHLLANRVKCPLKAQSIELVIIDGLTSYAAEKQVYGDTTNTIARLVREVLKDYQRCFEVMAMAS